MAYQKADSVHDHLEKYRVTAHLNQRQKQSFIRELAEELEKSGVVGFAAGAIGSYLVGRMNEDDHHTSLANAGIGASIGFGLESVYRWMKEEL